MIGTFAELLAAARAARGLSQSRLADAAGFDHSYICRLEAGKREPSRDAVMALAGVLRLTPVEVDKMLVSAGYRPLDDSNLFVDEPVIAAAIRLLRDQSIPEVMRANFRAVMTLLVKQWSTAPSSGVAD